MRCFNFIIPFGEAESKAAKIFENLALRFLPRTSVGVDNYVDVDLLMNGGMFRASEGLFLGMLQSASEEDASLASASTTCRAAFSLYSRLK